jgi:predicted LPLAT superfamily acyltransferase
VNLDELPTWADPVADPFRRDPAFWRAVFASADSAVLIVVAGVASVLIGTLGGGTLLAMAPFAAPAVFVGWAVVCSYRSSRASRVWFRRRAADDPDAWRDSERTAVASVFVHAVLRNRLQNP